MLGISVHVAVISARLGHKSIRTTLDIYSHMIHGQDEEAVQKWEEYQREARRATAPGLFSGPTIVKNSLSRPQVGAASVLVARRGGVVDP